MVRIIDNKKTAQAFKPRTEITEEMMAGATGPITKVISERRSHRQHWRIAEHALMIVLDIVLIILACYLAYVLRFYVLANNPTMTELRNLIQGTTEHSRTEKPPQFRYFFSLWVCVVVGFIIIFASRRLYHIRLTGNWFRQVWTIISSTTIGTAFLITCFFFSNASPTTPSGTKVHAAVTSAAQVPNSIFTIFLPNSRLFIPFIWISAILVLCLGRLIVSGVMGMLYRMGLGETRVLVVGSGRVGKMVMQCLAASPELGYSVVGFLHDLTEPPGDFGRFKMLGTINDISMAIRSMHVDEVIIALPSEMNNYAMQSVKLCEHLGASFKLVPDMYELNLSRIDVENIEGIPLLGIKQVSLATPQRVITRLIDISVSLLGLIIGSPLYVLIAFAVKISSPGSIVYKQERVGLDGKHFSMFKFRSMYSDADQRLAQLMSLNEAQGPIFKMKSDPRRTPVGSVLRRTSLDELPQLFNILKGEMSLVGPRPPLPSEVAQYEEWQKIRLAIKPGLTGLWQVRGRSNISFEEGVLMDIYYIENWSLRLYIQTLVRTIPAVIFSRGAY